MKMRIVSALMSLPICFVAACAADPELEPTAEAPAPVSHSCVSTPDGEAKCFATFTEAIAAATGGAITDAPPDARDAVDDPDFTARINALAVAPDTKANAALVHAAANVVIGIVYKDANYGGFDTWVFNQYRGCYSDLNVDFQVPNLNTLPYSSYGFNDSISSFHSYSGCATVLYDDWYYGGATSNGGWPVVDQGYVGDALNDRTSSIRWF